MRGVSLLLHNNVHYYSFTGFRCLHPDVLSQGSVPPSSSDPCSVGGRGADGGEGASFRSRGVVTSHILFLPAEEVFLGGSPDQPVPGASCLKYKRLDSTRVSLVGGLSAVTDCQLRLWASSDDCLEMLSA